MPIIYFIAMLIMLACGINVLWINSRRRVNQIFAGVCFVCTLYFAFTLAARYEAYRYFEGDSYRGTPWIRLTWTMTGLMPLYLWALFYVVSGVYRSQKELVWKIAPWAGLSLALCTIAWTQWFITDANLPDRRTAGVGYWAIQVALLVSATAVLVRSRLMARRLKGIKKIEFQYLTINCGALSVFAVVLPLLTFLPVELRKLVTIPIVCYGITGWSLASRRVYHSSHIYLSLIEHAVLLGGVGFGILWGLAAADHWGANIYARVAIIGVVCLAGYYGHDWLRRWFRLKPEQQVLALRQRLIRIAEAEADADALLERSQAVLAESALTTRVKILRLEGDRYVGEGFSFPLPQLKSASAFVEGWVTSVSLTRVRTNESDLALLELVTSERLGAIFAGAWTEGTPTVLVALGERENELPYTYPEIRFLQELAHVVDGYYTRAKLRLQARQAEQLAALGRVGACVAHEMRNPMETLRAFAEMLPDRMGNPEFMNDFAVIVPKEAERVLALAEQVLDMAKPRQYQFEPVGLHPLIEETTRLLQPAARERNAAIHLELKAGVHEVTADANALRQVLINLVKNAIEAGSNPAKERVVIVRTRGDEERVFLEVEDNGPGIPDDVRKKLFTPFATSGKRGGLGLGLAICHEITKSHCGSISAESGDHGGSLFRVALPLQFEDKALSA